MALLQAVTSLNKRLSRTRRLLSDIDDLAGALEQRKPLDNIVGPGGAGDGRGGAQFMASSVGPGVGGFPEAGAGPGMPDLTGRSVTLGGGGDAGAAEGGSTGGVINAETNRDKIGAIIAELGITPPPKEEWDKNGTGPGEFPGLIIATVLEFGKNAPRRYLIWCAGWLVYSSSASLGSKGSHGQIGSTARGPDKSNFGNPTWAGNHGLHDDPNFGNPTWAGSATHRDANFGNPTWAGSAGGMTSGQARSIATATGKTASATEQVVSAVKDLTAVVKGSQNGIGARAGGYV